MNTRIIIALVLMTTVFIACSNSTEETEEAKSPPEASRSVVEAAEIETRPHYERQIVNTAEIMKLMMDPMFEQLKDAIAEPPEGRKAWRQLYITSFNLAEMNNLLFSREPEKKKEYIGTDHWVEESLEAVELLTTLAESVKDQSEYDVLKKNFIAVLNNCNQCHVDFEGEDEIDDVLQPEAWGVEVKWDPSKVKFL